jgi:hypothetical protein
VLEAPDLGLPNQMRCFQARLRSGAETTSMRRTAQASMRSLGDLDGGRNHAASPAAARAAVTGELEQELAT